MQDRRSRLQVNVLDTIPEMTRYRDDGCDIHPACLTCPLPRCRYDEPYDPLENQRRERNLAIWRAYCEDRLSVADLVVRFGVSRRTIHRVLQAERMGTLSASA
jgi:hypothetical protein